MSDQINTTAQLLVDGEWRDGGGEAIPVFNPATGQQISTVHAATEADVDAAVAAAAAAFPAWSELSIQRRVQFLHQMRRNIEENKEELARAITLDQGKTLDEARGEVLRATEFIETAIAAPMLYHSTAGNVAGTIDARHVREPLGVCVAITPFNFPVMNPSQFSAWALVTGNTLVLKGSEQDPIATTSVVRLLNDAGLPPGVLNLVHGRADAAQRLIDHPDVVAVSCITSSPVAKAIFERASLAGKRVQANGGAKNPIVVAPDADLDLAAEGVVTSAFGMAGQRCLAGTRIIAVGDIYDELVEKIAVLSDKLVVGAGADPGTTLGPVVSLPSRRRLEESITTALADGATAVRDGRDVAPQEGTGTTDGYFVGPTILTGLPLDHPVDCAETFGPVIVIHRVESLDQAIDAANDTEFGNASTIFTRSGTTARQFEKRSRAGNVGVNTFPAPPANFTMGGLGTSFYGDIHVCGDAPLRFYTEEKLVVSRW
ncbi:CoA-acylating methylmalonate-semialdehyde dehydrogenase [Pimelobacter simplex]|uniref:CoA-acylating methylmalonate-semialdehyde dehydrogenase n=1 Tax=Nocardioides simplex TaxID=2045 RepID=UPI00214F8FF2|nr:CoA-acylating methylmalonate-semialdehyde dehydrogenase [Pimelobacter simplex]UUW91432.1 CoA-acylating methylmalonate-semialdehyde dehydrogenase [Pimelobacter simplex]UUW95260.1 CoA-acylating methylmalonate-semialdehyde dehydrogenase [Pimelobacter simplex]